MRADLAASRSITDDLFIASTSRSDHLRKEVVNDPFTIFNSLSADQGRVRSKA